MNGKRKVSVVGVLIAMVLLTTIIVTRCNITQEKQVIPVNSTPSPTELAFSGILYEDKSIDFTMLVPSDWTNVIMKGNATFIHKPSSSSIQIEVSSYEPWLLYISEEYINEKLKIDSAHLCNYAKLSDTDFIYEYNRNGSRIIERIIFDRETSIKISCLSPSETFEDFRDIFLQSLNSINWNAKNPIPDEFYILYSEFGNCEYAIPKGWTYGNSGASYYAQNENTGATMSLVIRESENNYSYLTKEIFISENEGLYPELSIWKYANDNKNIHVEGTYESKSGTMVIIRSYTIKDGFEYIITFISPRTVYKSEAEIYANAIKLFRIF